MSLKRPVAGGESCKQDSFLCQAFCSAAFMTPSSRLAKTTASTNAEVSAIGPAYMTPSIPKKTGKMTIRGSRKSTCLVRDIITPSLAFPMEVKKQADIGWHEVMAVILMLRKRALLSAWALVCIGCFAAIILTGSRQRAVPASGTGQGNISRTVVIDPGHGGSDSGAVGTYSKEKDITLAISKKVASLLSAAGANVIMTRTTDVDVYAPYDGAVEELQARCNIANAAKADVFVCIHIDSFDSPSAGGVTAYYNSKTPYDYGLANYIHLQNMKATNFADRGVKTANFYVLLHTNMPATLLELGFISNPNEEKALNSDVQQQNFAESIVKGLADYFNHNGN